MDNGKVVMVTEKGHIFFLDINTEKIEESSIVLPRESNYLINSYTQGAKVTALKGGNAVITGGLVNSPTYQNHFWYDLKNGTFQMIKARFYHYSILLPDGKVLLVGGSGAGGVQTNVTEIYDPDTKHCYGVNTNPVNMISYSQSIQIISPDKIFCMSNPYTFGDSYGNYNIFNFKYSSYTHDNKLQDIFSNSIMYGVTVVKLKNGDLLFNGLNHQNPTATGTFKVSSSIFK